MIVQIKEIKFYRHCPKEIQDFVQILSVLYPRHIWESGFSSRIIYGNVAIAQRREDQWYINAIVITTSTILTTEMFKKVKDLL
jgi:hypothetical protein